MTPEDPKPIHRGSNFAISFLFLPKPQRLALERLYAFCRVLDDVADDPNPRSDQRTQWLFWREELRRCYSNQATHPITLKLQNTIRDFHLTRTWFEELLLGVEMDLDVSRYSNFVHLSQYCYRVAGTVGLLCLEIFDCRNEPCRDYAVALGLAFQITNILRDVKEDGQRGRIYIPQDELRRFGYSESDLLNHVYDDRFVNLMEFQADRAEDYFRRAAELLKPEFRPRLVAPEIMASIYRALLGKIRSRRFNVFETPIRLSRLHKAGLAFGSALKNRLGPGRWMPQ